MHRVLVLNATHEPLNIVSLPRARVPHGDRTGLLYLRQYLYLMQIGDPALSGEMAGTAAHELLHAAYAQLSPADHTRINTQLESATARIHSAELTRTMRAYRRLEPGQRNNELHSILGTDYAPLDASLEQYYRQYFTNRSVVVADSQRSEQTFTQLDKRVDLRHERIVCGKVAATQVNALVQQYNQTLARYNALSRELRAEEPMASSQ